MQGAASVMAAYTGTASGLSDEQARISLSIGPRVIALALSKIERTGQPYVAPQRFLELCSGYLNDYEPQLSSARIEQDARELHRALQASDFPKKYLDLDQLKQVCGIPTFMARIVASQSKDHRSNLNTVLRAWLLLNDINLQSSGALGRRSTTVFGLSLIELFRAGLGAFAQAISHDGMVSFAQPVGPAVEDLWGMSAQHFDWFLSKIAVHEFEFASWFEQHVIPLPLHLQRYCDDPFSQTPLVRLKTDAGEKVLMPAPSEFASTFVRQISQTLALSVPTADPEPKNLSSALGMQLHLHVGEVLRKCFGSRLAVIPDGPTRRTDFRITLDDADVVIEMKSSSNPQHVRSLLSPVGLSSVFVELHKAALQLAATASDIPPHPKRALVPIIVVGEGTAAEAMPFLQFSASAGLLRDLNLTNLEVISWPDFEVILSRMSLRSFSQAMRDRRREPDRLLKHPLMRSMKQPRVPADKSMHRFEHFASADIDLSGGL